MRFFEEWKGAYPVSEKKKYLSEYTSLMLDWDPSLNEGKDPSGITSGSHIYVYWRCHKCGRVFRACVKNRVNGNGCTCDASERKTASLRRSLVQKNGSLSETRPDLAAQWHPELNGELTPDDVTAKSTYKAWWMDDDGNVWRSEVAVRNRSANAGGVPKHTVIAGVNDLETLHPEIASTWDHEKNGGLLPSQVLPGSDKCVWWICEKGHEYKCSVSSRTSGRGCGVCAKEKSTSFPEQALYFYIKKSFPDAKNRYVPEPKLETDIFIPGYSLAVEYDGAYYHASARKQRLDAVKNRRLKELGIRLIRVIEEGGCVPDGTEHYITVRRENSSLMLDSAIAETFDAVNALCGTDFECDADIARDRAAITEQYVMLQKKNSIATVAPSLLSEWNTEKNGRLKPEYVQSGASGKVWWRCGVCGHEWQAAPFNRVHGQGCPVCSGSVVAIGINDLCTTHPALVLEWNSEKNGELLPSAFSAGSGKRVWWRCGVCGYEWQALISNRTRNQGCPRCAGKIASADTSLSAICPGLAAQWHPERNGKLTPDDVTPGSNKSVWWLCEACGHEWQARIFSRSGGRGCPCCAEKRRKERKT